MKIAVDVLERYVRLDPEMLPAPRGLRDLLDDLGIEVKRQDKEVLTLELLANRGDHHCYEGVAREVAARLALPLAVPPSAALEIGPSPVVLSIESELCLVYTATVLTGSGGRLPAEALRPLVAAGMASVSAPVDATNLANLELGQPTHAFDADKVEGAVHARLSRAGERAWLLFEPGPREIPAGHLVIADDRKILAIAGVIGCEDSKTTASTTRILLESATFDPVAVRKASRALGVQTDSSARFERGSDPARPLVGAGRVVHLLERAGWARVGATGQAGSWVDPERTLWFELGDANRFLGLHLSVDRAADILERLGYAIAIGADGRIGARVPPHRLWDVEAVADLYEDLARIEGYNEISAALPPIDCGSLPSDAEERRSKADDVLVGLGFYEAITDAFHSRQLREKLGIAEGHPLWDHVATTNAVDRGYSLLKNEALGQAVEAVAENLRVRNLDVKLFEWTRTFHPGDPPTERPVLWAIASGTERPRSWIDKSRPVDVAFAKGIVAELAIELGIGLVAGPADPAAPLAGCLHPGRQGAIRLGERVVGLFGEVHPSILNAFKIRGARPVYLEIEATALTGTEGHRPPYSDPPTWHPIERNLSFALPHGLEAGRVAAVLRAASPEWLERIEVVDLFARDGAVRTVTWALFYGNADNTRTADEVNAATERAATEVLRQLPEVRQA